MTDSYWFYAGLATYGLGVLLCIASVSNFAKPAKNGINLKGLYEKSKALYLFLPILPIGLLNPIR